MILMCQDNVALVVILEEKDNRHCLDAVKSRICVVLHLIRLTQVIAVFILIFFLLCKHVKELTWLLICL